MVKPAETPELKKTQTIDVEIKSLHCPLLCHERREQIQIQNWNSREVTPTHPELPPAPMRAKGEPDVDQEGEEQGKQHWGRKQWLQQQRGSEEAVQETVLPWISHVLKK